MVGDLSVRKLDEFRERKTQSFTCRWQRLTGWLSDRPDVRAEDNAVARRGGPRPGRDHSVPFPRDDSSRIRSQLAGVRYKLASRAARPKRAFNSSLRPATVASAKWTLRENV